MLIVNSANEAWLAILAVLAIEGEECSPRGHRVLEVKNCCICIENPKKRIVSNPLRKISLPYAFGELLWYLRGRNDLEMMQYYSANMANFSDDGKTLNSAYGRRIFGLHPQLPFDQWEHVKSQLQQDNDTRQAIIHLHTPNNQPTKDEVCTLTLQFMIRDGALDMFVNMRSNDAVLGFVYDVFSFTSLQEFMANELGLPVGKYYHNVASMHIYEKHFDMMRAAGEFCEADYYFSSKYDQEFSYEGVTLKDSRLLAVFKNESIAREGLLMPVQTTRVKSLDVMTKAFCAYKQHKDGKSFDYWFEYDNIYDNMLRNQFAPKGHKLVIVEGCDGVGKTTFCRNYLKLFGGQYIHFKSPLPNFNPYVYYQLAMSEGDLVFDRSFVSELVYAPYFEREPMISQSDINWLYFVAVTRGAEFVFLLTEEGKARDLKQKEEDNHIDADAVNSAYTSIAESMAEKGYNVKRIMRCAVTDDRLT